MKKLISILSIVFLFASCQQENAKKVIEPKDTENFKLIGNVKSVHEEIFITNDSSGKKKQKHIEYVFDENQNLIKQKVFNHLNELIEEIQFNGFNQMIYRKQFVADKLVHKTKFLWNSRKQLVSEIKLNPLDYILEKKEFVYEIGFLKKETYQNFASNNNTVTIFQRNEKGLILEEIFENPKGIVKSIKKFTYDEKQNKLSETQFDENNQIVYSHFIQYNKDNLPILEKYFDANGQVMQQYSKEYDNQQNMIKIISVQTNVETVIENYIYDSNKKLLEFESIVNNEKKQSSSFTYDERGNETEIREVTPQDTFLTRFSYQYDEKGNWISKIESKPNGTQIEYLRIILYH